MPVWLLYGLFINTLISFTIISFAVFILVKAINKVRRTNKDIADVKTKKCPFCYSVININAKKCPYCCSSLISD